MCHEIPGWGIGIFLGPKLVSAGNFGVVVTCVTLKASRRNGIDSLSDNHIVHQIRFEIRTRFLLLFM